MKTPEQITLTGLLSLHTHGDTSDALFLSSLREPLAAELDDLISHRFVTVRYWITDREMTKEEANEAFIRELYGRGSATFSAQYSELTGYLWTDQYAKVGGHDLINELTGFAGKWLIMEITYGQRKTQKA